MEADAPRQQARLTPPSPASLRHACGFALANKGHDTRALQAYLGHRARVWPSFAYSTHRGPRWLTGGL